MIITCPNCNKQFKIDNALIPQEGRELQCGACNKVWFYKIENESETPLKSKENISVKKVEPNIKKKEKNIAINQKLDQEKIFKSEIKKKISIETPKRVDKSANKGSKIFSYLIVSIISFVALIILLDTLKTPLINVFPGLEIILFNLFETLQDIKVFIIDLI